jgi:hypothetical protein
MARPIWTYYISEQLSRVKYVKSYEKQVMHFYEWSIFTFATETWSLAGITSLSDKIFILWIQTNSMNLNPIHSLVCVMMRMCSPEIRNAEDDLHIEETCNWIQSDKLQLLSPWDRCDFIFIPPHFSCKSKCTHKGSAIFCKSLLRFEALNFYLAIYT